MIEYELLPIPDDQPVFHESGRVEPIAVSAGGCDANGTVRPFDYPQSRRGLRPRLRKKARDVGKHPSRLPL